MSALEFIRQTVTSPMFAGGVGAALSAAVLYSVRAAPMKIFSWVKRQLTVELIVDNSDDLFDRLAVYLARSEFAKRTRYLRTAQVYDYEIQSWTWSVTFGLGWHLLQDQGDWFLIHRALDEKAGFSLTRRETMTIRTIGRGQRAIRALMKRAEKIYADGRTVRVCVWHQGSWITADHKAPRPFSTIYIPAEQKQRLIHDLTWYLGNKDFYRKNSTPYRRGYLFEGPPGTGKSSLALAMASYAHSPLYMLNLNTCGGDTGLLAAFNFAEPNAILVIEDIDTAKVSHNRDSSPVDTLTLKPQEGVSLGGLLNAIDGVASRESRILILTSNDPDKIDPALLRAGRVDLTEHIGLICEPEARQMAKGFMNGGFEDDVWFRSNVTDKLPMSAADLQGILLAKTNCENRLLN
jgi:chaperone BCS1